MVQLSYAPVAMPVPVLPEIGRVLGVNCVPPTDLLDRPTGCCPRFNPDLWDGQSLHFENKRFARAYSPRVKHVPQDMAPAYAATASAIEKAGAWGEAEMLVLNRTLPRGAAEHLFAVGRDVPRLEMVRLSGDFVARVFEGPYEQAPHWQERMKQELAARGFTVEQTYFYYTTCPACAELFGHNYVVAVAKLAA